MKEKQHKNKQQGSEIEIKSLKWCNILYSQLSTVIVNRVMYSLKSYHEESDVM